MVMSQGAWQLAIGLTIGVGAAGILLKVIGPAALQNFLFHVNALDPVIYCSVAALLAIVAAASCLVPARRATRVNPIVALRAE
jgi:ABC-type antimicrobial peptide transport system permease subunit